MEEPGFYVIAWSCSELYVVAANRMELQRIARRDTIFVVIKKFIGRLPAMPAEELIFHTHELHAKNSSALLVSPRNCGLSYVIYTYFFK